MPERTSIALEDNYFSGIGMKYMILTGEPIAATPVEGGGTEIISLTGSVSREELAAIAKQAGHKLRSASVVK